MTYLSEVLADHPLHYWRCADPAGTLLNDIGSSKLALAQQGGGFQLPYTGPVSGGGSAVIIGQAFRYDDTVTLTPPMTVECCVWQAYYAALQQRIVDIVTGGGTTLGSLLVSTGGQAQGAGPAGLVTDPAVLPKQAWHHLALAFDVGGAVFYRDGVQVATGTANNTAQSVLLAVGGPAKGQAGNTFAGAVSEVAIYTSKLSAARIAAHYAALDNLASVPVYRPFGSWDGSTGGSTLGADESAAILAAVRKTFV